MTYKTSTYNSIVVDDCQPKLVQKPDLNYGYNLISNNCLTIILKILEDAGYTVSWPLLSSPKFTEGIFKRSLLVPYPSMSINGYFSLPKSTRKIHARRRACLNEYSGHKGRICEKKTRPSFEREIESLDDLNAVRMFNLWNYETIGNMPKYIYDRYNLVDTSKVSFLEMMGYESAPKELYNICQSEAVCISERRRHANLFFGKKQIDRHKNELRHIIKMERMRSKETSNNTYLELVKNNTFLTEVLN